MNLKVVLVLAVALCTAGVVRASGDRSQMHREQVDFLAQTAKRLIDGCRTKANDGTTIYTPDGKAHYAALWVRDFTYMVENAGEFVPTRDIEGCLRLLLKNQRADGAIPDRVEPSGLAVYSAGPVNAPAGEPNLDNPPFIVILADEYLKRLPKTEAHAFFQEWSSAFDRAMDYIPRSERGLVYNDPVKPHSPYGFTDAIGKTGELCIESLLYWTACKRLEHWNAKFGTSTKKKLYHERAKLIEKNLDVLFDEQRGAFYAATKDCHQLDVWANAFAVYLEFPLGKKRDRIVRFLIDNYGRYVWQGQVRHLLAGEYWQRLLAPIGTGRYQNGACWATASGWVMTAIAKQNPALARKMGEDLIAYFQQHGVFECVTADYQQLDTYVASATNPLPAIRKLLR